MFNILKSSYLNRYWCETGAYITIYYPKSNNKLGYWRGALDYGGTPQGTNQKIIEGKFLWNLFFYRSLNAYSNVQTFKI